MTMIRNRRQTLKLGAAALTGLALPQIVPYAARAASGQGDAYPTETGEITIRPVSHASFVMTTPGPVIYCDPVGGAGAYEGMPAPELILITHEHGDHYDEPTLTELAGEGVRIVANPAVAEMMPEGLRDKTTVLANGDSAEIAGLTIDAIPAYNTTEDRLQYHPEGRDNGYVLGIDGRRVYIAGDTEDIPEMRALEDIDIAFVPMNLPYTMTVEQAAAGVAAFRPAVVYPYHYRDQDPLAFESLVAEQAEDVEVVQGPWYG